MRRKIKPIDLNELIDADDINRTTIKGEMRKLYKAIHQKLTEGGWSARDMVKWLEEKGVSMSVELFRVYLRDLDREHGYNRSKNEFDVANKTHTTHKAPLAPSAPPAQPQSSSKKNVDLNSQGEFDPNTPPPGITKAEWNKTILAAKKKQRPKHY